mmetsp:Transcript_95847/g.310660  ORF Transcript_95847/g.310660 Transcript_95847/m.310660 type:complete len:313 (+) Transcript_95847:195-1133(+)
MQLGQSLGSHGGSSRTAAAVSARRSAPTRQERRGCACGPPPRLSNERARNDTSPASRRTAQIESPAAHARWSALIPGATGGTTQPCANKASGGGSSLLHVLRCTIHLGNCVVHRGADLLTPGVDAIARSSTSKQPSAAAGHRARGGAAGAADGGEDRDGEAEREERGDDAERCTHGASGHQAGDSTTGAHSCSTANGRPHSHLHSFVGGHLQGACFHDGGAIHEEFHLLCRHFPPSLGRGLDLLKGRGRCCCWHGGGSVPSLKQFLLHRGALLEEWRKRSLLDRRAGMLEASFNVGSILDVGSLLDVGRHGA